MRLYYTGWKAFREGHPSLFLFFGTCFARRDWINLQSQLRHFIYLFICSFIHLFINWLHFYTAVQNLHLCIIWCNRWRQNNIKLIHCSIPQFPLQKYNSASAYPKKTFWSNVFDCFSGPVFQSRGLQTSTCRPQMNPILRHSCHVGRQPIRYFMQALSVTSYMRCNNIYPTTPKGTCHNLMQCESKHQTGRELACIS